MSTIRAYLGIAGLLDVGYHFYNSTAAAAARSTAGVVDEGGGWYAATGVTLLGDNVRWDSAGTPAAAAREDLTTRNLLEFLKTKLDIGEASDPVLPIPAAPVDGVDYTVVYADLIGPEAQNAKLTLELLPSCGLVAAAGRVVAGRRYIGSIENGRISVAVPSGHVYAISSSALNLSVAGATINGDTFNLTRLAA